MTQPSILPVSVSTPEREKSRKRIRVYLWVTLVVVVVSMLAGVYANTDSAADGGSVSDFVSFYTVGQIVAEGHTADLYDPKVQADYQTPYLQPVRWLDHLPFSYPPQVALAYAPFSVLSFKTGAMVNSVLMLMAAVAAVVAVRPLVPVVDRYLLGSVLTVLLFPPLAASIPMGQNVALSLLLLVWIWRSLDSGGEAWAGVAVGLLMFKPQFGIPVLGLLLVGRHFRAVGFAGLVVAATAVLNTAVFGVGWVSAWVSTFGEFTAANEETGTVRWVVSPVGFLRAAFSSHQQAAVVVGWLIAATVAAVLVRLWSVRTVPLDLLMAVTAPGVVLVGPHSMAFAPALLLLTVAVFLRRGYFGAVWGAVLVIAGGTIALTFVNGGPAAVLVDRPWGFNPGAVLVAATFVFAAVTAWRGRVPLSVSV